MAAQECIVDVSVLESISIEILINYTPVTGLWKHAPKQKKRAQFNRKNISAIKWYALLK